jgi:uncharacterized protein (TIGR03437 family)
LILLSKWPRVSTTLWLSVMVGGLLPTARAQQFVQQGSKLVGSGAINPSGQGRTVALSADGDTAIVGAPGDATEVGAAWVYTRTSGVWAQQTKLTGSGLVGASRLGWSVALSADGNTALLGGPADNTNVGAAWVFVRTTGAWVQQGNKLVGTGATGPAAQGFSAALSSDGNTAIIGGNADNGNAGAAWVFTRSNGVWTQQGSKLVGTGAAGPAAQGYSIALSGDGTTALVGGNADNGNAGAAWVFTNAGGPWTQQGTKLVGTGAVGSSNQGNSVALSGDGNTALVGGPANNSNAGAGWVFTRANGLWTQQTELAGTGASGPARQGWSVALAGDGNTALLGGPGDLQGVGAVWVFAFSGGVWTQPTTKRIGSGFVGQSLQGTSVAISADGKTITEGGPGDNNFSGAVWVAVPGTPPTGTSGIAVLVLVSSFNPSLLGRDVIFVAALVTSPTGPKPTGTVQFFDGTTLMGSAAVNANGQAIFTTKSLAAGSHAIVAVYGGDSVYQPTQTSRGQVVSKLPTVVVLTVSSATALYGQPVVLIAVVGPPPPAGFPDHTGQIEFRDQGFTIGKADLVPGKMALTATLTLRSLSLGTHQFQALLNEDATWLAGHSTVLPVTVAQASSITILTPSAAPGNRVALRAQVAGLPPSLGAIATGSVQFVDTTNNSVLASATLTGATNSATAVATVAASQVLANDGIRPIVAVYSGDSNFKNSTSVALPPLLNGAAFPSSNFAPDEIATILVPRPVTADVSGTLPLTTSLGGATLTITDSAAGVHAALLYAASASPGQINFVIPSDTAPGLAVFKATNASGASLSTIGNIVPTAPGIFTANGNGKGVAAGQAVHVHADGSQTSESIATFDSGAKTWVPNPISLGPDSDQLFLVLFATGLRQAAPADVTAAVNGTNVPVAFSGAQGTYPGLDQVNLQIPPSLAGAGAVSVAITVGSQAANPVTVAFQ